MAKDTYLDPLYKWTGGKRKEIKTFSKYYPEFITNGEEYTFVEPFFGGGAVYWSLNAKNNVINDIDEELVNFIRQAKSNPEAIRLAVKQVGDKIKAVSEREKAKEWIDKMILKINTNEVNSLRDLENNLSLLAKSLEEQDSNSKNMEVKTKRISSYSSKELKKVHKEINKKK